MKSWREALSSAGRSGNAASILSTVALAACGKQENGTPYGATNAISHWVWGDRAAFQNTPSIRYTILGYAIHHGASMLWATVYEKWFGELAERRRIGPATVGAAIVASLACFVDYRLTPRRLRPGYEMRLSQPSLLLVYATFGVGILLGALSRTASTGKSEGDRKDLSGGEVPFNTIAAT